jgi:hypothetical protein
MRGLKDRLVPNINTFWFEAWRFENEKSLLYPLVSQLQSSLPKKYAKSELEALKKAILIGFQGLPEIVDAANPAAGKAVATLSKMLGKADAWVSSTEAISTKFTEAISEINASSGKNATVVFIDDLDRCLPESTLKLLEDLKHITMTGTSNLIFVIGIDEVAVEKAISARYANFDPADAQAYLNKIVRFSVELPPIFPESFDKVIASQNKTLELGLTDDEVAKLADICQAGRLVNMRKLLRVFHSAHLLFEVYKNSPGLPRATAFAFLLLREFWPDLYRQIAEGDVQLLKRLIELAQYATITDRQRSLSVQDESVKDYLYDEPLMSFFNKWRAHSLFGIDNLTYYSSMIRYCQLVMTVQGNSK